MKIWIKLQNNPIFSLCFLFIIGLIALWNTFSLALYGDEWQMMWFIKSSIAKTGLLNYRPEWRSYEGGGFILVFLSKFFGYNGTAYYFFSYLWRFFASASLYLFLKRRGIKNIYSLLGSMLFIVSPVGIGATDWMKNVTSYISITFFILGLNILFEAKKSFKLTLLFVLSLIFSIYINPIRAHGIILTVVSLFTVNLLFQDKKRSSLLIIALFLMGNILMYLNQQLGGTTVSKEIITSVINLYGKISTGNLDSLKYLFSNISQSLTPPTYIFSLIFTSTIILLFFWKKELYSKNRFIYISYLLISILLVVAGAIIPSAKKPEGNFLVVSGLYFFSLCFFSIAIEIYKKRFEEVKLTLLVFSLGVLFIFTPWLLQQNLFGFDHRYFIYAALALPIILAVSLNRSKHYMLNILGILLICLYMVATIKVTSYYKTIHGKEFSDKVWQQFISQIPEYDFNKRRALFYFSSDPAISAKAYSTFYFGFSFHIGVEKQIWDIDMLPLVVLDNEKEIKSLLTDGKVAKYMIGYEKVFAPEDVFVFKIYKDKIIREKLL